jgi:hypothetical protein
MADIKVYRVEGEIFLEPTGAKKEYWENMDWFIEGGRIYMSCTSPNHPRKVDCLLAELQDADGIAVGDLAACELYLATITKDAISNPDLAFTNGGLDVILQDPTTPPFDLFFSEATAAPTTLTAATVIDSYDITVASTAGIGIGTWIGVFNSGGRYYWGEVVGSLGLVLTMDTPLDFVFPIGSNVLPTTRSLAVDGSVTPRVFEIQVGNAGLEIDVTRIIISIVTTDPPELGQFGDQPPLTRGLIIRYIGVDGARNILNWKTNYEIGLHTFDLNIYEQVKQADVNAVIARYTLGGQSKHGTVIRVRSGESLQLIVQDDLSGLLTTLAIAEGSEVSN